MINGLFLRSIASINSPWMPRFGCLCMNIYHQALTSARLVLSEVRWLVNQFHPWIRPLTELDWTPDFKGMSEGVQRDVVAVSRLAVQEMRVNTKVSNRGNLVPTECCAPQVGSCSLPLLFVLPGKGLFRVSGLRSFSRSLATCAQRA